MRDTDIDFDICFLCDGVFLDDGELRKLTGNRSLETWLVDYMGNETDSQLECPRCRKVMNEEEVKGVTLDVCNKCHGIWFDGGELDEIKGMKSADFKEIPPERRAKKYDQDCLEERKKGLKGFFRKMFG